MSIVINGIKMPEAPDEIIYIAIWGDGTVIQTGESWRSPEDGKCYYTVTTPEKFGSAVSVPPHGDLIDRNTLEQDAQKRLLICDKNDNQFQKPYEIMRAIALAPTVIQANESDIECENRELCDKHDNKTLSGTYKEAADAIETLYAAYTESFSVIAKAFRNNPKDLVLREYMMKNACCCEMEEDE